MPSYNIYTEREIHLEKETRESKYKNKLNIGKSALLLISEIQWAHTGTQHANAKIYMYLEVGKYTEQQRFQPIGWVSFSEKAVPG